MNSLKPEAAEQFNSFLESGQVFFGSTRPSKSKPRYRKLRRRVTAMEGVRDADACLPVILEPSIFRFHLQPMLHSIARPRYNTSRRV